MNDLNSQKLIELENRIQILEQTSGRNSSTLDRKVTNDQVSDEIHDILWNKVFYISSFATASITTVAAELLDANGRESDTSAGLRFRPERESRFKTSFYINAGLSKSIIYILSPAISTSTSIGTLVAADKSFVGVKIVAGTVYLVSCRSGIESIISTNIRITDSATNILEISYHISHATVFFNDIEIGDIPCNLLGITFSTFFPFLISVGSSDGTSVNLTTENFEFLQKRK